VSLSAQLAVGNLQYRVTDLLRKHDFSVFSDAQQHLVKLQAACGTDAQHRTLAQMIDEAAKQRASVFRIVGFTAFVAYAMALPQASIWYRRNWRMTFTGRFDGLVFGLLTGGVFGWLWPH
jgi:hypothetical protein